MEAEPRTTIARSVGRSPHIVRSCNVPMTLMSWMAARGRPGSGNWTMSLWTTVSTAAARTTGAEVGAAQVGLHDVDALGEARGRPPVCRRPRRALRRVIREAPRQPRTERVRHAGDQDAPAATRALRCGRDGGGRLGRRPLGRRALGRRGAPARGGARRLELLDASLERLDALAQGDSSSAAAARRFFERLAHAPGGRHQLVGDLLGALRG